MVKAECYEIKKYPLAGRAKVNAEIYFVEIGVDIKKKAKNRNGNIRIWR